MRIHLLILTFLVAGAAQASGETLRATNPRWKAECGSCHVAYPARLLPAESWKAMMAGLDKHFGSDASIDPATTAEILAFLEQNAGRRKPDPAVKPQLRITETHWFKREHDEVPAATWKNPLVKSAANCAACHTRAEQGDFNERSLRLPK
ncbi:MAG TPA: diheme cytochrome c [Methylophilaceae bacterium]|nr:diheme cytochrome c [Methylophilaceae bacterium]